MLFQLAWRNTWRNPYRTWGLVCSIAVSMAGVWVFGAVVQGLNAQRLQERVDTSLGHGKITRKDFLSHKPVQAYFVLNKSVIKHLDSLAYLRAYAPRLNIRASIEHTQKWHTIDLYGVQSSQEKQVLALYKRMKQGTYLPNEGRQEAIIGNDLARLLHKKVGDSLSLYLPQRLRVCIVGIYEVPSKDFSETHVFIPYTTLQTALSLPIGACHQLLFKTTDARQASLYSQRLQQMFPAWRVRSWIETAPDLALLDVMTSYFLQGLMLFICVLLGILQYILSQMTWQERLVEWSRLYAWGLTQRELAQLWAIENGLIYIFALSLSSLVGWITLFYLGRQGIDLAMFAEGLRKLGYSTHFFPLVRWHDWAVIVMCFAGLPCLSMGYVALKMRISVK